MLALEKKHHVNQITFKTALLDLCGMGNPARYSLCWAPCTWLLVLFGLQLRFIAEDDSCLHQELFWVLL